MRSDKMIPFHKKSIQRTSIELSKVNFDLAQQYASLANGKLTYVLNYIIKMMVNIPNEVRNNLMDFCRERLIEAQENSYTLDERVKARIDAYKRLLKFLEGTITKKDVVLSSDVAKVKSVITFDLSNFRVASREAKKLGTTFSRYLNYLISLTLDVPTLVQGELSIFCAQKSASVDEQNSLYWMYRERNIQESYKELAIFWAQKDPYTKGKNMLMRKTDMKDGYIVYPADWVVLDGVQCDAKDSVRACVIEVKNGKKYGMPHFLFFTNKDVGDPFTIDEENAIHLACIKAVPNFAQVLRDGVDQPTMPMSDPRYKEAAKRFLASPIPGIFYIPATDDPYYCMQDEPLFGCRIVRNVNKNED